MCLIQGKGQGNSDRKKTSQNYYSNKKQETSQTIYWTRKIQPKMLGSF